MTFESNDEMKQHLHTFLHMIIKDAVILTEYGRRKTVSQKDVCMHSKEMIKNFTLQDVIKVNRVHIQFLPKTKQKTNTKRKNSKK